MQGKNWTITINNWEEADIETAENWDIQYIILAAEVAPATGTRHLQGWIQFKTNMRMSALKRLHDKAHWELMRGSIEQNEVYCRKANDIKLEKGKYKSRKR